MISVAFCCHLQLLWYCCFYSWFQLPLASSQPAWPTYLSTPSLLFSRTFISFFFWVAQYFWCCKNISWKILCSNCLWIGTDPRLSWNTAGNCRVPKRHPPTCSAWCSKDLCLAVNEAKELRKTVKAFSQKTFATIARTISIGKEEKNEMN